MTIAARLLAAALFAAAPFVIALPATAQTDPRIRTSPYHADIVNAVATRPNFETMISFAPDERIENVALGDSTTWQVTPNKRADTLFVKPVAVGQRTNMAVLTDRRTYLFELRSDRAAGPALFNLRFSYPIPPRPVIVAIAAPAAPPPPPPIVVHTAWEARGAARLRPIGGYDDGTSVYLSWRRGAALPAILAAAPDGGEEPIDYAVRGDTIVVPGVPARLTLRVGRDQAVLTPTAHAPSSDADPVSVLIARR